MYFYTVYILYVTFYIKKVPVCFYFYKFFIIILSNLTYYPLPRQRIAEKDLEYKS